MFVSLGLCLVGGLGLYAAVVLPVILHALRSRWPFRFFVVVSGLFGLLNLSLIFSGLYYAGEAARDTQQVLDNLGGLLLGVGVFLPVPAHRYVFCIVGGLAASAERTNHDRLVTQLTVHRGAAPFQSYPLRRTHHGVRAEQPVT